MQGTGIPAYGSNLQLVCRCLQLCYDTHKHYSHRLSEILLHQATLLEHIVTDQRYYSEHFRVAFYGSFPVALRNKQFIVSRSFSILTFISYNSSTAEMFGRNTPRSAKG